MIIIKTPIKTAGIIGSGPAGATLASLLAMKGIEVTLFDDGRRPELVVGESLIPAVVPVLRKLGLEERVAAICQKKPGVTFTLNANEKIEFCFQSLAGTAMPAYAYNAPRPAFDHLFDARADELGVQRVRTRAKIERVGRGRLAARGGNSGASAVAARQAAGFDRGCHGPHPAASRTRWKFPPKSARAKTWPISRITKASRKTRRADRSSSAGWRTAGAGAFRCRAGCPSAW